MTAPLRFARPPDSEGQSVTTEYHPIKTALANCPSKLGGRGAKLRRGYVKSPHFSLFRS